MQFNKHFTSPHDLVQLLLTRGLIVSDLIKAERYIKYIGYYRLSAYMYPLLQIPKEQHLYKPYSSFDQVLMLYRFDRQLRLLIFNQIEKIEVAVRSAIVNITCNETGNPFWMTDPVYFYNANTFTRTKQLIDAELMKSREVFIEHFRNTYTDPYPPAWMLAEILPLGVLTRIYDNIKCNQIRKKIAQEFSMPVPVFNSWMTIITVARNNCCHHARIWNRTYALQALSIRSVSRPWITIPVNQKKTYFSICIIKYFMDTISPNNDMKAKIDTLLTAFPSIDLTAMGFPKGWENEPLWN